MRSVKRAMLVLSALLMAVPLLLASPASAEPLASPTARDSVAVSSIMAQNDPQMSDDERQGRAVSATEQESIDEAVNSNAVSINRWKSATAGFDSNLGGWDLGNIGAGLSRETLQGFMMTMGNLSWDIAANLSAFSSSTNLIEGMVWYIDNAMAVILKAFMNPSGGASLLGIITVVAIISVLFSTMYRTRGAELWKRLGATLIIAALFWTTAAQLTGANGPIGKSPASYSPTAPTPSWMVLKTTQVLDKASTLSTGLALDGIKPASTWKYGDRALGCDKYIETLESEATAVGNAVSGTDAGKRQYQMRTVVDRLWRESGLRTWINAQYGANNEIKYNVFCYHLDVRSESVSASEAYRMIRATGNTGGIKDMTAFLAPEDGNKRASDSPIVNPSSGDARMGAMTGWAVCNWQTGSGGRLTATLGADFPGFHDSSNQDEGWFGLGQGGGGTDGGWDSGKVQELCDSWRTSNLGSNWADDDELKAFFVPGHSGVINSAVDSIDRGNASKTAASQNRVSDFLSSMIGTGAGGGSMATLAYSMLSPIGTLPISLVAIGKLLAELMLVFSVVTLMLSLLGGLFTKNPFGEKLVPALKQMVMVAVLAVGVGTVMSFMLIISNALATIGVTILGQGGLMTTVWTSLTPLMALIGMSYVWKKVFKAPSPFSAKGFGAWAKGSPAGAAALGSAVGSGIGSYAGNRLARAGRGMARSAGNRAMENVTDKFMGRSGDKRKSGMKPDRDAGKSTSQVGADSANLTKAEIKAKGQEEKRQLRLDKTAARAEARASRPSLSRAMGLDKASREAHRQQLDFQGKQGLGRAASWLNHSVGAGALNRGSEAVSTKGQKIASGWNRALSDTRERFTEMREAGATGMGAAFSAAGAGISSDGMREVGSELVMPAAVAAATIVPGGVAVAGPALAAVGAVRQAKRGGQVKSASRERSATNRRNAEKVEREAQKVAEQAERQATRQQRDDAQQIDAAKQQVDQTRETLDRANRGRGGR
ncbi:hypothetical protein EDF62_1614 [Leucobacter luti]|uniref:TrbL/VirB6 plasmid conjugal transfer protein n=2 Tax=Leucobacter luti TaxID=340320 RepID=A0A4R6S0D3_9MICO|nr:hypothetical protein EDF62_1614 [Leucobacter luti]